MAATPSDCIRNRSHTNLQAMNHSGESSLTVSPGGNSSSAASSPATKHKSQFSFGNIARWDEQDRDIRDMTCSALSPRRASKADCQSSQTDDMSRLTNKQRTAIIESWTAINTNKVNVNNTIRRHWLRAAENCPVWVWGLIGVDEGNTDDDCGVNSRQFVTLIDQVRTQMHITIRSAIRCARSSPTSLSITPSMLSLQEQQPCSWANVIGYTLMKDSKMPSGTVFVDHYIMPLQNLSLHMSTSNSLR